MAHLDLWLPEIIRTARKVSDEAHDPATPTIALVHRLVSAIRFRGQILPVEIVVKEHTTTKGHHAYDIEAVTIKSETAEKGLPSGTRGALRIGTSTVSTVKVRDLGLPVNPEAVSKVVDADGKPRVVYHGAPDAKFDVFKSDYGRFGFGRSDGAFWFASDFAVASTYADDRRAFNYQEADPGVISAYLKLQNPLVIEAGGQKWRDAQRRGKTSDVIEQAKAGGYDGVIIRNVRDRYQTGAMSGSDTPTTTYVVFESTQIKSAIGNSGAFDPANPSILASSPAEDEAAIASVYGKTNEIAVPE